MFTQFRMNMQTRVLTTAIQGGWACLILTRRSRCMQSSNTQRASVHGVGDPARRFGSVLPHWSLQLLAIHVAGALWGADQRDPGNPPRQEHCHAVRILGLSVDLSYQLGGCHGLGQVDHVGVGPRTMRQADARLPRKVLARCCPVCSSRSMSMALSQTSCSVGSLST